MTVSFGTTSPGLSNLALRLDVSEKLHRMLFSDSDWNRIVRASMYAVGEWFHVERDPLRFSEFARSSLGYDRKQGGLTGKQLLAAALADGTMQKLADRFFHGYNPWRLAKVPGPMWQTWLAEGRKAGRYNISVTGTFSTAKRDLRSKIKRELRAELLAKSQDNPDKFATPLVHAGELRDTVMNGARITATATASTAKVRISRDDPHGQSHPVVGAVMRRMAPQEVTMAADIFGRQLDAMINGASTRTIARGKAAGQVRRALTQDQRETIAHTLAHQRGGVAS